MESGSGNIIFFTISELFGYFRQLMDYLHQGGTDEK
jgi:hypothetical protein